MESVKTVCYTHIDSPAGTLLLAGNDGGLQWISFSAKGGAKQPEPEWKRSQPPFREAIRQLRAYFSGELTRFDLPLDLQGTTFQRRVWRELLSIPYGATVSYGDIARKAAHPKAVRAVGTACGRNPLAIVVPCHRVIGSDGTLTGYGGGLAVKGFLLALEMRVRSSR